MSNCQKLIWVYYIQMTIDITYRHGMCFRIIHFILIEKCSRLLLNTRGFKSDTKGCTHFWWFLGPHGDLKVIQKGVHISGGS